jgi:AcrR family transcriptional regulator
MTDGRRVRGDATRLRVARLAAGIATTHGLDSITLGTLAAETGVSKSGILTVFGSREAIQLAAIGHARQVYVDTVITPVLDQPSGVLRLRALLDTWVAYLAEQTFPGGCFVAATSAEFGHRTGAVADAVRAMKSEWLRFLAREFAAAGSASPDDDAFRVDAYLVAANTARELLADDGALDRARRLAREVVDALA